MKSFKFLCVSLIMVALVFGFTCCKGKEGANTSAGVTEDQAQPADQAAQPAEPTEQSAGAQAPLPGAPTEAQPQDAAQAPEAAPSADETGEPEVAEITGTVLDSGGEIVVFTDQGNYAVTGEDLSGMVGKTVRVRGSLQEEGGRQTINVVSVYEVK